MAQGAALGGPVLTSWSSARHGFWLAFMTENRRVCTEEGDDSTAMESYGAASGKPGRSGYLIFSGPIIRVMKIGTRYYP
jgi:hypothetical protein